MPRGSDAAMKVYVYPADSYGCGHYRTMWPAAAVRDHTDWDVEIMSHSGGEMGAHIGPDGNVKAVIYPEDADMVVLQRPTHKYLSQSIPLLREAGITVVVDMDDDLRTIHPSNPAFMMLHPRGSHEPIHTWKNASDSCKAASLVTVSSTALARRYGQHGRVRIIRNGVPENFLKIEHHDSEIIGWGGSVHSHPNDLQAAGNSIAKLMSDGYEFKIVGSGDDVARVMGLNRPPESTGVVPFHDWGPQLTKLGIGIAPLADTAFNEAKSWLKPLEYAAVGIPWVASDRVEYRELYKLGCGVVVERPREWERELRRLLESPTLREEMSEKGRSVAFGLSIENRVDEWYDAWKAALDNDR